jgi:hypothetical protein
MPVCPNCGTIVPEGAIACGKCGATLVAQQSRMPQPFQSQGPSSSSSQSTGSTPWLNGTGDSALSARLERALRRTELLSYALVGLSVVLLILLFV